MTKSKAELLKHYEAILMRNRKAVASSLEALYQIKKRELYRERDCHSMLEYIQRFGAQYGYKKYSRVMQEIDNVELGDEYHQATGQSIPNEGVGRELAKTLRNAKPQFRKPIMKVIAKKQVELEKNGKKLTAETVKATVAVHASEFQLEGIGNEFPTLQSFFDMLHSHFHFDVDVCANEKNHKCPKYFNQKQNGLAQDWTKFKSVWCNPPYYSKDHESPDYDAEDEDDDGTNWHPKGIFLWIEKAYKTALSGTTVVVLVPNNTEDRWFHWYGVYANMIFLNGRLKFGQEKIEQHRDGHIVLIFRLQRLTESESDVILGKDYEGNPRTNIGFFVESPCPLVDPGHLWHGEHTKHPMTDEAFEKKWGW
jgi:phage N-6-adenine-methyltransferase